MYYFIDDEHKNNFFFLMKQYGFKVGEDGQHEAAIYVSSIRDIFKLITKEELEKTVYDRISPLYSLAKWDEDEDTHVFVHPGLTGSTRRMSQFGLSLYNGYPVALDEVFGSVSSKALIEVLLQAIKIRIKY